MSLKKFLPAGAIAAALVASAAYAGSHAGNPAVGARKAHMQLNAFYLGVVGGMARGNTEYDAELATIAATDLARLSEIDISLYWPEGTDSEAMPGESRTLPALWSNLPDALAKYEALGVAADNLAAEAGNGLEALQAAIGPVGAACGACHEAYQQPRN